jgi:hypothetical protein
MNRIKAIASTLLIVLSLISLVEMFNVNNTEYMMINLYCIMFTSTILSAVVYKSIK